MFGHILWRYSLNHRPKKEALYAVGTFNESVPVAGPLKSSTFTTPRFQSQAATRWVLWCLCTEHSCDLWEMAFPICSMYIYVLYLYQLGHNMG